MCHPRLCTHYTVNAAHFARVLSVTCSYRTNANCLLNDPADVAMNITEHPGQRYSADKQCQIIYGPESFYCAVSLFIYLFIYLLISRTWVTCT